MYITLSLLVVVLFSVSQKSYGLDPVFSQFYANPLYLNPAFAGARQCTRVILNYRNHPFPSFGTFSTYSFSADTYSPKLAGGIGLNIIHDSQAGLLSHSQAGAFYAWQGRLSRDWNISLGIQASWINYRLQANNLVFPDQYNPYGSPNNQSGETLDHAFSHHNADFSTGLLVYNQRFYAGASVHHLSKPSIDVFTEYDLSRKYTLMMGYDIAPPHLQNTQSGGVSFSPNIIIQSQSDYLRLNLGMYAHLAMLTAGLWYRHSFQHQNSLIFTFGVKQVNYAIGYSYDHSLSGFSANGSGAHEIGVLLNFNCPVSERKYRILNCPTF